MRIERIEVKNYRLLRSIKVNLEEVLSIIIGKNNTGKTSLLTILEKFLSSEKNSFSFDDFSIDIQKNICKLLEESSESKDIDLDSNSIRMSLIIDYSKENDNLQNIPILNLDPQKNIVILEFNYGLTPESLINLKKRFRDDNELEYTANEFLHKMHGKFFTIEIKAIDPDIPALTTKLENKDLRKIINFQMISAKRGVANDDNEGEKNRNILSKLSRKYFEKSEDPGQSSKVKLQKKLRETDKELTKVYGETFKSVIKSIKDFGYNQPEITIKSVLEAINLMRDNTSIVYSESEEELPEEYNGLGYMNLFAIIFQLHIICDEFHRNYTDGIAPADINLLFIEEPEAHTHPQMQYIFINNIKNLLAQKKGDLNNLQTIITTHSPHITSQSNFEDIKYFRRDGSEIISKNFKDLKSKYNEKSVDDCKLFKFVKQYLTIHRSELFFADKIIFVEGDTERILLPAIMKKLDLENKNNKTYNPLLAQNISIVEVGNYAHIFEKFIEFIGVKALIITDIDSVKGSNGETCEVSVGEKTSNSTINFFLPKEKYEFAKLKDLTIEKRKFMNQENIWEADSNGQLLLSYQQKEDMYHARTLEDAFISINLKFIINNKDNFKSLKNVGLLESRTPNFFDISQKCIESKASFATDVLMCSTFDYSNWNIPQYIKEGLLWLNS